MSASQIIKYGIPSSVMTNEQYHANPAISRSGIKLFNESPYKFWAHYLNPDRPPVKQTEAMFFGSAFHAYILERGKFHQDYIIEPKLDPLPKCELLRNIMLRDGKRDEFDRQKKAKEEVRRRNDEIKERFADEADGKLILTSEEWQILDDMCKALMNHPQAWDLIQGAEYEESYFWRDEHTNMMCKARPDIAHPNMIIDLKTVNNASERFVQRSVFDYGYDLQMAMIRDGIFTLNGNKIENFILICVEKDYPHEIGIYFLDNEVIERAHVNYKNTLLQFKECFKTNTWPSYNAGTINIPAYLR